MKPEQRLYNLGSGSWLARANGAAVQMRPLPALTDIGLAVAASKQTTAPINHTRPSPRKHSPDGTTPSKTADIRLQHTTHLSTSKGRKAKLAWFNFGWLACSGWRAHKWSPISCMPSVRERKHAGHWTTQPTNILFSYTVIMVTLCNRADHYYGRPM